MRFGSRVDTGNPKTFWSTLGFLVQHAGNDLIVVAWVQHDRKRRPMLSDLKAMYGVTYVVDRTVVGSLDIGWTQRRSFL